MATVFSDYLNLNGFFSASWAREELRQSFFWDVNNFFPSSPHITTFQSDVMSSNIYACP